MKRKNNPKKNRQKEDKKKVDKYDTVINKKTYYVNILKQYWTY